MMTHMAFLDDGYWLPICVTEETPIDSTFIEIRVVRAEPGAWGTVVFIDRALAERFGPGWVEQERIRKLRGLGILSLEHPSGGFMGCGQED